MRFWPFEKIKVQGPSEVEAPKGKLFGHPETIDAHLANLERLMAENEAIRLGLEQERNINYRILENRALREKVKAQKQANKDRKKHYEKRISELVQVITDLDVVMVFQRAEIQKLRQQLAELTKRPCNHIGTALTISRVGDDEIIEVTDEKNEVTFKRVIKSFWLEDSDIVNSQAAASESSEQSAVAVPDGQQPT